MARTSAVDQLGVGDRVMQLAIEERKSIPSIIEMIADETGAVLSPDMIRNWLRVQPAEIIEKAERAGLAKDLKPLLDYGARFEKVMDRIETLMDKLDTTVTKATLVSDSAFVADVSEETGVPKDKVRRVVKRVQDEHMGPKLMALLARYLAEGRKMIETAHKLDPTVRQGRSGPATGRPLHINNLNVVSGEDLNTIVQEARLQQRRAAAIDVDPTSSPRGSRRSTGPTHGRPPPPPS